jgi:hypothetical protein
MPDRPKKRPENTVVSFGPSSPRALRRTAKTDLLWIAYRSDEARLLKVAPVL